MGDENSEVPGIVLDMMRIFLRLGEKIERKANLESSLGK